LAQKQGNKLDSVGLGRDCSIQISCAKDKKRFGKCIRYKNVLCHSNLDCNKCHDRLKESEGGHLTSNTAVAPHFTNPESIDGRVNLGLVDETRD